MNKPLNLMRKFEMETRLINFNALIIKLLRSGDKTPVMEYFRDQLVRSSASAALNYSGSMSAESDKDFIHKLSIALKELRESYSCLRIMITSGLMAEDDQAMWAVKEANELISILYASISTKRKNIRSNK